MTLKNILLVVLLLIINSLIAQNVTEKSAKLRYDGLYVAKTNEVSLGESKMEIYNYIKFYDDGKVYTQSVNSYDPLKVAKWFGENGRFERSGTVVIKDYIITFNTNNELSKDKQLEGPMSTDYKGIINSRNKLTLEIKYNDGKIKKLAFSANNTKM